MKKTTWSIAIIGVVAVAVIARLVWSKTPHEPAPVVVTAPPSPPPTYVLPSNAPVVATKPRDWLRHPIERPSEFTEEEKMAFTNLFVTKLKPAAEKWALVYSNRVPFNLADLTPDKVVRRLGRGNSSFDSYIFVMGDITFGIQVFGGDTYVNYLASRQAAMAQITMPNLTDAPDLSMPVTREQVAQMVQADCGQQFPPNEVTLTPTGESGSLMGGADAEVGKEVNNPLYREFSISNADFSIVFAKDGTLASYLRTP